MQQQRTHYIFLALFFLFLVGFFLIVFLGKGEKKENKLIVLDKNKIHVIDGDTIEYKGMKFRIVGIDTPEKGKQKEYILEKYGFKNESCLTKYGWLAKEELEKLINSSKEVKVEIVGKDPYGRYLAFLYLDGKDVGEILVKEGLAFLFDKNPIHKKYLDEFYYAKEHHLGVWSCN
jgi:micrococcal nuclease